MNFRRFFRTGTSFFYVTILFAACASAPHLSPISAQDAVYYQRTERSVRDPLITLSDRTSLDNINGTYPDRIFVKSLTQTFCKGYSFMIRDGKIWMKKDGDPQWALLLKTGLPFSTKKKDLPGSGWFASPASIREIAADGDCLFAFDDHGRMYNLYTQYSTIEHPFRWINVFGWPNKVQLSQNALVKNKRGWSMGVRRKDILWYEDRFGNQHHYGTMGLETLYFLTENGQEIRFTDSGLPVDFSHTILGPERGSFVARNISVSGDTIFLIADDGTMYTRLIDFDTMGCDPMFFKYTYTAEKQAYPGSDYRSNFTPWGLPAEDWKKQPAIKLTGKARLTRFLSIHQNGQGNDARELRVAGLDEAGNTGYYSKQLTDTEWKFTKVVLNIHESDFLSGQFNRGKTAEYAFNNGYVLKDTTVVPGIQCSIENFTLTSEGSCTLRITKKTKSGTEEKQIPLSLVEMWTYMVRFNPGLDGTPKHFFATATVPKEALQSKDPEFDTFLNVLFGDKDKSLFAFSCEATNNYVQIDTTGSDKNQYTFFLNTQNSTLRPEAYKSVAVFTKSLLNKYTDTELKIKDKVSYTTADSPEILQAIQNNRAYITLLQGEIETYNQYKKNTNASRWGYNVIDLITSVTLLNHIDFPKIKTMTSFGDTIMNTNARNFRDMYEYRSLTYPHVIELVQLRIDSYRRMINELASGQQTTYPDLRLRDTFPDYFSELHIPLTISGQSPTAKSSAEITQISETPMFPGFMMTVHNGTHTERLFIELKNAAAIIYNRPLLTDTTSALQLYPVVIPAAFIPITNNRSIIEKVAGVKLLSKKEGSISWDGKKLTIKVKNSVFNTNILFEGINK